MSQAKRKHVKPLLNRKETKTLLTTLKWTTVAGTLSLTMAGWSLLAQADAHNVAQATPNQPVAVVASRRPSASTPPAPTAPATSSGQARASASKQVVRLDIVGWVRDSAGDRIAVVRDSRGTLWYVMGSDIPRLEQGMPPLVQPQPVQRVTRSRAS
ncbi:MAG: hypothetical protein P8186_24080 [Anaerolineae bacterium]